MKKLLTFFSVLVLGLGSSLRVASCKTRVKHDIDENDLDANQDLDILNKIKKESYQYFVTWWKSKSTVNIKNYPDQEIFFTNLVKEVKTKDNELTLRREEINKYRFLTQLFIGFKAEFANLNQSLQNKYSNYYPNSMPLLLMEDDISFTLYNINFGNIAKLLKSTSQELLGITMEVNIPYEVRFKEIQPFQNKIDNLVTISNNLDALTNVQDKLDEYFIMFVNNILKEQNFRLIVPAEVNLDAVRRVNILRTNIKNKLKEANFLFNNINFLFFDFESVSNSFTERSNRLPFRKSDSTLMWAGEGYNPDKLTPENFLKFYIKKAAILSEEKYYYFGNIKSIIPVNFTIENLLFKCNFSRIKLKSPVKILKEKDKVHEKLEEFAKVIMAFWHYYKLETYNEYHRLVFKMRQNEFDALVESASVLEKK